MKNDDWTEGVHNDACLAEQDFDNGNDAHSSWDRNHDFTQSHQECMEPLNM